VAVVIRRAVKLFLVLICAVLTAAEAGAQGLPALEYRVKAAFLLNFAKFVEWPEPDPAAAEPPIVICVVGEDPLGPALDQVVQGESVGARHITVERLPKAVQGKCHVAFIPRSEKDVPRTLEVLGPGVLTVGDEDGFLRDGGMIAFVIESRRVRFDVNQAAVRNGSIRLSSRLLGVARFVTK
jgi:hypothetical protein